jgi:hypothetical protein
MPIGPVFTPEQIQIMHKAFEAVCAKLRLRPSARVTDDVAVMIVDLAAAGVLNFDTLTAATLAALAKSPGTGLFSAPVRRPRMPLGRKH